MPTRARGRYFRRPRIGLVIAVAFLSLGLLLAAAVVFGLLEDPPPETGPTPSSTASAAP